MVLGGLRLSFGSRMAPSLLSKALFFFGALQLSGCKREEKMNCSRVRSSSFKDDAHMLFISQSRYLVSKALDSLMEWLSLNNLASQ